jgi:subfamily B ATP-binding cassette protein MsbA
LFALQGRYYDLYTRQHGLETNLFLAPGEGDYVPSESDQNGSRNGSRDTEADPLRVVRGEVR